YSDILGAEINHWWLRDGLVTESDIIKSLAAQTCAILMPPSKRGPLETEVVELTSRALCKLFPNVFAVTQLGEASSFGSARLPGHSLQLPGRRAEPKLLASPSCVTANTLGKSLQRAREVNSTTSVSNGPRLEGGIRIAQVCAAKLLITSL